ncbi:FAD-dependent oxidoreductase [Chloroflexota bacterium]
MSEKEVSRIIVIGASAAGLRAAARARRLLKNAQITVIDEASIISYSGCGMPYFVSGDVENPRKLRETTYGLIRDPEFFLSTKDLKVVTETQVEKIDRDNKKVFCKSLKSGETSEYPYDKLVLATGSSPIILPNIPEGIERVSTFKTLSQAIYIRQALQDKKINSVGIIGAGPIGCELAEAFSSLWGAEVVLIDAAPTILPNMIDAEMATAVEKYLNSEGVEVYTDCPLNGIDESDEGIIIKTGEDDFPVDHAVVAVGVRPNSRLAADCGLTVGSTGGIVVDERMVTSDADIYAAGDCVEVKHLVSGKSLLMPLGSLANRQGRTAGSNLGGGDERFGPVVGSAVVKIFDMNVAATGLTEAAAHQDGFNVGCAWGTFMDKADFFPEAANIHLKMVFDKDSGRLLGLQGYGKGDLVKRVDVFASLLKNERKLDDILDAEFAYAPPYAPAVDPLFSLACAARNSIIDGIEAIPPDSLIGDRLVLDVREVSETKVRPLREKNLQHIPLGDLRTRWQEIPNDKPVVCVCPKGLRSAEALRILKEKGFHNGVYLGGGLLMKVAPKSA